MKLEGHVLFVSSWLQHDIRCVRWRRYSSSSGRDACSPDPVQKSLARAEARHIICACTADSEVGKSKGDDGDSAASFRSLWIFWFGDEPLLKEVLSEELHGEFYFGQAFCLKHKLPFGEVIEKCPPELVCVKISYGSYD